MRLLCPGCDQITDVQVEFRGRPGDLDDAVFIHYGCPTDKLPGAYSVPETGIERYFREQEELKG
jgi:hypothetical protein